MWFNGERRLTSVEGKTIYTYGKNSVSFIHTTHPNIAPTLAINLILKTKIFKLTDYIFRDFCNLRLGRDFLECRKH